MGRKVLEVLISGGDHPTKLIMPLLDKVTERGMFSLNVSSEGCLLLLSELKDSMQTSIIKGGGRLG